MTADDSDATADFSLSNLMIRQNVVHHLLSTLIPLSHIPKMNPASAMSALRAPMRRAVASRGPASTSMRFISVSAPRFNEAKEGKDGEKKTEGDKAKDDQSKKQRRSEPEEDGPPQSPFKVFLRVFREEIDKNQGWQQNVKQLQGDVDKLADSAAMKKAREAYERSRVSIPQTAFAS